MTVLDLSKVVKDLLDEGWHKGGPETAVDNAVVRAIHDREREAAVRRRSVVDWLHRYKVLMGLSSECRDAVAGQIVAFADERKRDSLQSDAGLILSEFKLLESRIRSVAPRNADGSERGVTSLTSKALWCCYPNDVPIFDENARSALTVLSWICRTAPAAGDSEYGRFVEAWMWVYRQVETVIEGADLSDCPYKVRALDRVLWCMGQGKFYGPGS